MLPHNGGYVVWCERAFGPQVSWVAGMNGTLSSIFDLAIYPTIFGSYLKVVWKSATHAHIQFAKLGLVTAFNRLLKLIVVPISGSCIPVYQLARAWVGKHCICRHHRQHIPALLRRAHI